MKTIHLSLLASAALATASAAEADPSFAASAAATDPAPLDAEVVFVLDTTGSMSGLIEGAKQKIWSIAGGIMERTGGEVRIGLVPYRDRGDDYVTRLYPLTNNLDQVYADLQGFRAGGGGDTPESVNQALHEAVSEIRWSDSPRVLKTIFLVGDCPPHMDYPDDVKYPESCALATNRNIVVSTVQCGGHGETTPIWQEIAERTGGGFTQIGQSGSMKMVETPFDAEIQKLNAELGGTVLPYGRREVQSSLRRLVEVNADSSAFVAGARNAVKAKARARGGESSLAAPVDGQDLTTAPELLATLDAKDLPEELQGLSPEERQAKLDEAVARRKALNAQLLELDRKRSDFLRKAAESAAAEEDASFDGEVLRSIDVQLQSLRSTAP